VKLLNSVYAFWESLVQCTRHVRMSDDNYKWGTVWFLKKNGCYLISDISQHSLAYQKHDTGLMKCVDDSSLLGNKCDVWWFGHITASTLKNNMQK